MKKNFLILILLINSCIIFSQSSHYFYTILEQGNEAFKNQDFSKADSLYSLCVEKTGNGNVFFNRAFARLNMSDTCGYCKDLEFASLLFDKEASEFFYKDCMLSIDTIFFSKDMKKVNPDSKYRYYEVNKRPVCDSLKYYVFHDRKNKRYLQAYNPNNLSTLMTGPKGKVDYTARAYYKDSLKVFYFINNVSLNSIIDEKYSAYINRYSLFFGEKYQHLKKYPKETLVVKLLVDDKGNIFENGIFGSERLSDNPEFESLKKEFENTFEFISNVEPILFQDKPVYFEGEYVFEF